MTSSRNLSPLFLLENNYKQEQTFFKVKLYSEDKSEVLVSMFDNYT